MDDFFPRQLGLRVKHGSEAAVHAIREYIAGDHSDRETVFLRIDYCNAFNSVDRTWLLRCVHEKYPEIYQLVWASYAAPSSFFSNGNLVSSEVGVHQGDPLGPFLFCLAINGIAKGMQSELSVWYMDDESLLGNAHTVYADFEKLIAASAQIGLKVNPDNCELIVPDTKPDFVRTIHRRFQSIAPGLQLAAREDAELLGAPLHIRAVPSAMSKIVTALQWMSDRLACLDAYDA